MFFVIPRCDVYAPVMLPCFGPILLLPFPCAVVTYYFARLSVFFLFQFKRTCSYALQESRTRALGGRVDALHVTPNASYA